MTTVRTHGVKRRIGIPEDAKDMHLTWLWILAGLVTLGAWFGVSTLSRSFIFGTGHADRPIPQFLLLYAAAWLAFAGACVLAVRTRARPIAILAGVGVLARALLLPSNLIQENDCYRYVLDGETLVHGVNPYANSPAELANNTPHRLRESLAEPQARLVIERIGHPEIPTVYPPLAQAAFVCGVFITPWDWRGQRYVFLACDLATAGLLFVILRELRKPVAWLVMYAWNPLVIKEVANSAHLDALTALLVVALVLALLRWERAKSSWGGLLVGILLAAATLTKLYPALLLPVVLAYLWRQSRKAGPALACGVAFLLLVPVAYVPFLSAGIEQLFSGLTTYAREWRRNPGAFAVIEALLPSPRITAGALAASGAIASTAWLLATGRPGHPKQAAAAVNTNSATMLIRALQATLLTWFLMLPAAYPWYAIPMLALSATAPAAWPVLLSGSFGLYYLHFLVEYRGLGDDWHAWIATGAHAPIWIALALHGRSRRILGLPQGPGDMKSEGT